MSSRSFEETEENFFRYYDNLPLVKTLSVEEFSIIQDKSGNLNLRNDIVFVLSKGIESKAPISKVVQKRHVLSANEIQNQLQNLLNKDVTLSNVYFHLQKLEDKGLVQIVDSLPSGRRFTSYYGRTARVFTLESDVTEPVIESILATNENQEFIDSLKELSAMISNKESNEIKEIFDNALGMNKHFIEHDKLYTQQFEHWIHNYDEAIRKSDVDLIQFYFLYIKLINYQKGIVSAFRSLKSLLGLPDLDKFSI